MSRFTLQGIVSSKTGEPLVQVRIEDEEGETIHGFQVGVMEAREIAQNFIESASNAVYDAALIAFSKENWPDEPEIGHRMVAAIREFRADRWGLPDNPADWSKEGGDI